VGPVAAAGTHDEARDLLRLDVAERLGRK